jgi:hypothetical protein
MARRHDHHLRPPLSSVTVSRLRIETEMVATGEKD